ncbi:MAG: hemerythrin domain-containing protein [Cyanobacteria bacterium]|nr:hemerythrin domain-containing protein [Cyanobacteriota bacterium]
MQPSFKEIVEEIVTNHHSFLRRELPKVSELLEALSRDCADNESLGEAQQLYKKVRAKIETHLKDEETVLFPTGIALESGGVVPHSDMNILERLAEMEKEHDGCGNALTSLCQMIETLPQGELREKVIDNIRSIQKDLDVHVEKENTRVHPMFLALHGQP